MTENDSDDVSQQWKDAVQSKDNKRLKHLYEKYGKVIDFTKIEFENGDDSLHYGARTNNIHLCKLLVILGIDVRSSAFYTLWSRFTNHYRDKLKLKNEKQH